MVSLKTDAIQDEPTALPKVSLFHLIQQWKTKDSFLKSIIVCSKFTQQKVCGPQFIHKIMLEITDAQKHI